MNDEAVMSSEFFYHNCDIHQKKHSYCAEFQFCECLFEYVTRNLIILFLNILIILKYLYIFKNL
jgi:hypothetical protein